MQIVVCLQAYIRHKTDNNGTCSNQKHPESANLRQTSACKRLSHIGISRSGFPHCNAYQIGLIVGFPVAVNSIARHVCKVKESQINS